MEQRQLNEQLNEQLKHEKQRIDEQAIHKQQELSQALSKLQLLSEQEKKSKEEQIVQMKYQIEQFKGYPQINEFRTEALEMTKALSRQLDILCHNISLTVPLCDISASMIEKSVDARLEIEKADERLTNFLSWQDWKEGKVSNLPKI